MGSYHPKPQYEAAFLWQILCNRRANSVMFCNQTQIRRRFLRLNYDIGTFITFTASLPVIKFAQEISKNERMMLWRFRDRSIYAKHVDILLIQLVWTVESIFPMAGYWILEPKYLCLNVCRMTWCMVMVVMVRRGGGAVSGVMLSSVWGVMGQRCPTNHP